MVSKLLSAAICLTLCGGPVSAQEPRVSLGLGYGAQSSYQHPAFVTGQLAFGLNNNWTIAPTLRRASGTGGIGWRAHVSLEHRFGHGWLQPYVGAGPSWTSERGEQNWSGSELGAMALLGLDFRMPGAGASPSMLGAFVEVDAYTHHYATGQALAGLRVRLGH